MPPSILQELWQGAAPTRKPSRPPTLTPHGQGQPGVVLGPAAVVPAETDQSSARPVGSLWPARGLAPHSTTPDELRSSVLDCFYLPGGSHDPVYPETQRSWPRAPRMWG